ncbi:MAG: hypothetical protein IH946_08265, partial [Bacteroidetes bacterium]|nr:hypothetical protein [Bacteroidota bacterium]
EAITSLNLAIGLAPCLPATYVNLAQLYTQSNDPAGEKSSLLHYYENCPSPHPIIAIALGKIYQDKESDHSKATVEYEKAIAYPQGTPIDSDIYYRLGQCYVSIGEDLKAQETWENGLRLDPNNMQIKSSLK